MTFICMIEDIRLEDGSAKGGGFWSVIWVKRAEVRGTRNTEGCRALVLPNEGV